MIAIDNAAPIERFGKTFKPWTKRQLIELAARLPLTKAERALVSYSDIIRYVGSIAGMDYALAIAASVTEQEMETLASVNQKTKVIGELIDILLGAYANQADNDDESKEEPKPPLAETPKTGQ